MQRSDQEAHAGRLARGGGGRVDGGDRGRRRRARRGAAAGGDGARGGGRQPGGVGDQRVAAAGREHHAAEGRHAVDRRRGRGTAAGTADRQRHRRIGGGEVAERVEQVGL